MADPSQQLDALIAAFRAASEEHQRLVLLRQIRGDEVLASSRERWPEMRKELDLLDQSIKAASEVFDAASEALQAAYDDLIAASAADDAPMDSNNGIEGTDAPADDAEGGPTES